MTNELVFEVMVMDLGILEKTIEQHNKEEGADFMIIKKQLGVFAGGQKAAIAETKPVTALTTDTPTLAMLAMLPIETEDFAAGAQQ